MTDKQIIIDVSDCSELCGTKCHILMSCTNTSKSDSCSEMPNCYYKQLKRKEQECEELKRYKSLFEKTRNLWNEARMNNYKLLDEIKDLKDSLKRTTCQSECYKHKEAEKLKQTLAEINNAIGDKNKEGEAFCDDRLYKIEQILQKISECEVEE